MDYDPFLDDGATEIVEYATDRPPRKIGDLEAVVNAAVSPHLALKQSKTLSPRKDYLKIRSPSGATQVSSHHFPVYDAIVKFSIRNRVAGKDAGVNVKDILRETGLSVGSTMSHLDILARSGAIRSVRFPLGRVRGNMRYYPTEQGKLLFSLASLLGGGVQVTTSGYDSTWKSKTYSEPPHVFHYFKLLEGREFQTTPEIEEAA